MSAAELYAIGRAAWASLEVPLSDFEVHVARLGPTPSPDFAADLYLACACALGVRGAIAAFESKYLPELERGFAKLTAKNEERAEARSQLLERLFVKKKIADYAGAGPLALWVRVAAMRTMQNVVTRKPRETSVETELLDVLPAETVDPELAHLQSVYKGAFREAFAVALAEISVEDRTLIHQRFIGQLSQAQLAEAYGVHVNTVARWLERARAGLESAIYRELEARLKVKGAELESILRLVRSQLDISLGS